MRLLLTSAGFQNPKIAEAFLALAGKPLNTLKVALIPTAARTVEERYYVEESMRELGETGLETVTVFDAADKLPGHALDSMDVLYMCGGNTFFILKTIRETGFDKLINKFIQRGGLYVGVSAGSLLVGPEITIAGLDSEGDSNDVQLADLKGLGFVPFAVLPHFQPSRQEEVDDLQKTVSYPIIPLTDEQALLVQDETYLRIG